MGPPPLHWSTEQIEDVLPLVGRKVSVEGKACLIGSSFYFKVRDQYAFDIDETVWLEAQVHVGSDRAQIKVAYDGRIGMDLAAGLAA